jgi:hypothetical protein
MTGPSSCNGFASVPPPSAEEIRERLLATPARLDDSGCQVRAEAIKQLLESGDDATYRASISRSATNGLLDGWPTLRVFPA